MGNVLWHRFHALLKVCSDRDDIVSVNSYFQFTKEYNVQWEDYMYTYNTFQGRDDLRKAVAEFLTDQAKSPAPLDPAMVRIQIQSRRT